MPTRYLACDLGAESGRLMLGTLDAQRLILEEVHRFANTPVKVNGSLHWDIARLFQELKAGLRQAAARRLPIASISTDSWGVDYLLLDARAAILPPTYHYRDPRCQQGVQRATAKVDRETIFAETGIQFMPLNTIFQLAAESPERLRKAKTILGIGDGFNFLLSGVAWAEQSLASTFQLYNPRTRTWSPRLLHALGLPANLFPAVVPAGTRLGRLLPDLARETGLSELEVVASCSHDTGAAVAAVPADGLAAAPGAPGTAPDWAYLSSGTWSLMGVELPAPVITDRCRELNFTNEIGYGGSIRLLKNISGLWIVQECRREWAATGRAYDYAALTRLAAEAPPFRSLVNPTDPRFLSPDQMPAKIAAFCRDTGQPVPATPGAMIRCALESLALLYRHTLAQIEQLIGQKMRRLHLVGGGSQNELLNQFAANALQIPVQVGPVEATATGNVLVQAIALGHLPSLAAARSVVRASIPIRTVSPADGPAWADAGRRFQRLLAANPKESP
ncbi:MAG: rhamnulokinase [Verrucomicrobia bacterium]|nr:rhamnulokinase [Verrucomicrobiota bacterium]